MERNERLAAIVAHLGKIAPVHNVPPHSYLDIAARMLDDASVIEAPHIFKQKGDTTEFQSAFVDLSLYQMMATAAFAHLFGAASSAVSHEPPSAEDEAAAKKKQLADWMASEEFAALPPETRMMHANVASHQEAKSEKKAGDTVVERKVQEAIKKIGKGYEDWRPERKLDLFNQIKAEHDAKGAPQ